MASSGISCGISATSSADSGAAIGAGAVDAAVGVGGTLIDSCLTGDADFGKLTTLGIGGKTGSDGMVAGTTTGAIGGLGDALTVSTMNFGVLTAAAFAYWWVSGAGGGGAAGSEIETLELEVDFVVAISGFDCFSADFK
jgi:hypothetical protein